MNSEIRTDEEIISHIKEIKDEDFFGDVIGYLTLYLSYSVAKEFINIDENEYKNLPRDSNSIQSEILDYMDFAWDKANCKRGLSANRSLCHMSAWLWMLGETNIANNIFKEYSHYGKPQLRAICEHFKWEWQQWDDNEWCNGEDDTPVSPTEVEPCNFEWINSYIGG